MEHIKAILIKFIIVGVLGYFVLFSMEGALTGPPVLSLLIAAIISYFFVDVFLLPMTSNIVATTADIVIWLSVGALILGNHIPTWITGVMGLVAIILSEWFFHKYMMNNVLHIETEPSQ